jgi:DNA primase
MNNLTFEDLTEVLDNVRYDGRKRNAIADCCFCGKSQKLGVSLVKDGNVFNCFSCGERGGGIKLMTFFDRLDLIQDFFDVDEDIEDLLNIDDEEDDLDYSLEEVSLPPLSKRVSSHKYLDSRGFYDESYFDFPVFKSMDWKYQDYVIIGVYMNNVLTGFVSRHIWNKNKIMSFNSQQKRDGGYQILRYRNSEGNEMARMLFGFDHIVEGETDTVILVEGAFDVIQLSQELGLFESNKVRAVASFGKKISPQQIFHLQSKGIANIIIYFDDDAVDDVKRMDLHKFFNVLIASTNDADGVTDGMDVGDLSCEQIEQCLSLARKQEDFFYNKVEVLNLK